MSYYISPRQQVRVAAARERTRLQRVERARALNKRKADARKAEMSPNRRKRVQLTKKADKQAAMLSLHCPCGKAFRASRTGTPPELCPGCAVRSLPPIEPRSGGHVLDVGGRVMRRGW